MNPAVAHALAWSISALSILMMLLRPRGIPEAVWLGAGAALLVLSRALPVRAAGHAIAEGADVYLFLAGMMLLAELAKFYGVFDWLAQRTVRGALAGSGGARGQTNPRAATRLFTLVYVVAAAVTVLMSNDATAVVLTPAVLATVKRLKMRPLPCLFACAFVANASSFVLPISNPANLVVFQHTMPPLAEWLAAFALPSAAAIGVTYALLRWRFRRDLKAENGGFDQVDQLEASPLSRPGKMTVAGIFVFAAVLLAASALKRSLGLPTFIAAILVAGIICLAERQNPWRLVREISWSVLPLVASLFVLVEAINRAGALAALERALQAAAGWPAAWSSLAVGFAVGLGTNFANNLALGLFVGAAFAGGSLQHAWSTAVMIGIDLGPNLSATGSLATILWLIALRREGVHVSAGQFLKTGLLVMPPALLLALCAAFAVRSF